MGVGEFKKPEAGPKVGGVKVGETVNYADLPAERKADLGDLDALKASTTPEPEMAPEDEARAQEGAEKLEALQQALLKEEQAPEPVDVAEQRLAEMAEPTEEDKREFLRSILGGCLYQKRYEMYGGMLVMTLHDIRPEVEDTVFTTLAGGVESGEIKTDDDWALRLDRLRLVTNVSSVRFATNAPVKCSADLAATEAVNEEHALLQLVEERMKLFPSTALYRAALQTVRVFARHMELMLDRALDSDFWAAGGLDSPSELMSAEQSGTESDLP